MVIVASNACNSLDEREQMFMADGLKVISTYRFSPESQQVLREAAQAEVACITNTDEVNYDKRLAELFADNLRRYRAGEPLRNRYDPARGY